MYDVLVIGGGINGAGIARDAAGRGLSVLLVEKDDLANATSSASTKLIHGGLRYLEQYDFKLVAESLNERERLLRSAPHIIWPLEFILPHEPHLRPSWLIRLGLFLYDCLGKREVLQGSKGIRFGSHISGKPLQDHYKKGFSYSDCWVEDARLVVLCAQDAKNHGADIRTRNECINLNAIQDYWEVELKDKQSGESYKIEARCVINAAGPWVRTLLDQNDLAQKETLKTRLVKGSHIILPRLYEGDHCYILQQPDQRIVFAIPYENDFTLIGTTDESYEGDPLAAKISKEEIQYLCAAVGRSFKKKISPEDIIETYSGVRPLLDSGDDSLSKVTRDYKLDLEERYGPPLLNIFGGKLTTFRKLSEQAVDKIVPFFSHVTKSWTRDAILPGGDIPDVNFEAFLKEQQVKYDWIDKKMLRRYARAYGTKIDKILEHKKSAKVLGAHYGDDLYEAEVRYLINNEWARTTKDILWRRSKLELHISDETKKALEGGLEDLLKERTDDERSHHTGT